MEWLESWLRDYRGTIIAVSHDRRFLDNMVTTVAELANGEIHLYSCGYEKFLTEREERRARLEAEWEQQKEKIEEIQKSEIRRALPLQGDEGAPGAEPHKTA